MIIPDHRTYPFKKFH